MPQSSVNKPARPIRNARSPRNGIGSGIVTSRTASATISIEPAEPAAAADRHGPAPRHLVGEIQADQRHEESVAVVLVGRPGVVEMDQAIPEQQGEQSQAEQGAEPVRALRRVASRTDQQTEPGSRARRRARVWKQAPRESAAMVGRPSLRLEESVSYRELRAMDRSR